MKKFCIKDAATMDVIASNLTEDEAFEMLDFYDNFFGMGTVFMSQIPKTKAQEYKNEFIEYFAELQEVGNLI